MLMQVLMLMQTAFLASIDSSSILSLGSTRGCCVALSFSVCSIGYATKYGPLGVYTTARATSFTRCARWNLIIKIKHETVHSFHHLVVLELLSEAFNRIGILLALNQQKSHLLLKFLVG